MLLDQVSTGPDDDRKECVGVAEATELPKGKGDNKKVADIEWKCTKCGETFLDPRDAKKLHRTYRDVNGNESTVILPGEDTGTPTVT